MKNDQFRRCSLNRLSIRLKNMFRDSPDKERKASQLGKIIMRELKKLDKVAYVRFASVYLEFEDVSEFMTELKYLVQTRRTGKKSKKAANKK